MSELPTLMFDFPVEIASVALVILMVAASTIVRVVTNRVCRDDGEWSWVGAAWRSVRLSAHALIWITGTTLLMEAWLRALAADQAHDWTVVINRAYGVGVILVVTLFLLSLLRQIDRFMGTRREGADRSMRLAEHVHSVTRIARIVVLITAALMVVSALGYDVSSLLVAGGVSGIVLGFAARDMLANVFGTLAIYLDRPFSVGDTIEISDKGIAGTVESITMRLTKIRNFDRQPVYVPNAIFSQGVVVNRTRMTHRRIDEHIGLRYQDMEAAVKVAAEIQAMLDEHPDIDSTQSRLSYVSRFSDSSVDIRIYVFAKSTDWEQFHAIKQDILMKASGIIKRNGADIAYPTRTLHVEQHAGEQQAAPPA